MRCAAGIRLWPGASTGLSDAAVYSLIMTLGLYGMVTVLAVFLVWSVIGSAVSLVRFLRRR
jgi:hypothetical protein